MARLVSNCNYCSQEKLLFLHVDVKERTNRHHSHRFLLVNTSFRMANGGPDRT